jgi:hypothetical protein
MTSKRSFMTSKRSFMTSEVRLMLGSRIFMASPRSFMLSRLTKNESTASWNGNIESHILTAHIIFCANYGKPYSIVKMAL